MHSSKKQLLTLAGIVLVIGTLLPVHGSSIAASLMTVVQSTAANLNATVVQPTAALFNATVVQSTASLLNATIVQPTASLLNSTVVQSTASLLNATVVQGTAANLNMTAAQPTASLLNMTAVQGTAANFNATVVQGTPGNLKSMVSGSAANGAALSGNPVLVCGSDGTNCRQFLVDTSGRLNVNQSQWNGTTVDTGSGVGTSGGTLRVYQATDQPMLSTAQPSLGYGAGSGATLTPIPLTGCDLTAVVNVTSGNTTQIVPGGVGRVIHVCHYVLTISLSGTAQWKRGTGVNCATGTVAINQPFFMATNNNITAGIGFSDLFYTAATDNLCLAAGTGNVAGYVLYALR